MSYQGPSIPRQHPYPVQPLRQFPRYIRAIELVFWAGVFATIWHTGSILWPVVVGWCVSSLVWYLIYTQFRCPGCHQHLTSRNEIDFNDSEHLFYDCDQCQITYDPQYSEAPDNTDSSED